MALFDNLIAYYKLDGNCRDSVNIYDGIPNNITFVDGKIGECAQTNGNSQYISLPNEVSVKGWTQVSYSGWCFIESTLSNEFYIITEIANSNGYTRAAFGVNVALLPFAGVRTVATGDTGSFQKVTGTSPMSTGTWYFLCGVFDLANGNIILYVNGVAVGSLTITASSFVDSDPYRIRIFEFDGSGSGSVRVDELGIWSKALSATEVSELYNNGAGKTYSTGTSGGTGVVIDGLFLSTSKPKAGDKGLLINNKFFIPFAESSEGGSGGGTSAEYYKCASVDTSAKTWSGYKAVFDSTAGTWSFESDVTEGLTYTSVTPIVGSIYSADALVKVEYLYTSALFFDGFTFEDQLASTNGYLSLEESPTPVYVEHDNGKALSFDGSGGRELTGFDFIKNEFKIEFDFKIDSWSTDSSWKGNASRIFGAGVTDNTVFTFEAYKSNGEIKTCGFYTGFIVQLATWHHASVEYKNNKLTVTFDSNTVSFDYNPDLSAAQTCVDLGGSTFDNFYLLTGAIDNFNLYTFKA